MSRRTIAAVAALVGALSAAAPALADDSTVQEIAGSPLAVFVGGRGQLQAFRAGETNGIFFDPAAQLGDAGFFLAFPTAQSDIAAHAVYGFTGGAGPDGLDAYTQVSQPPVSGDGTAGNPFMQVTNYAVKPAATTRLAIKQTTSYVNGSNEFDVRWDITNMSGVPLSFKALSAADFYFEGSDRGTGIFTQGPPRFVGGTNADTGRSGGFVEATANSPAWSHYQAYHYGEIWTEKVEHAGDSANPTFDDSVEGESDDNAGGVEWDDTLATPLATAATKTYEVVIRNAVPAALQFNQTNAGSPQRVPIAFVATAKDTSGIAFAGKQLRYTITGVNPVTSAVSIDANGNGVISDPGTNAGADTVIAYVDLNNDSIREENEPQASALATFVDNIPPTCAVKVSGDRPGGGGAGKPLVISVNCDSPATVSTQSTFSFQPKRKKGHKKPKKVTIKLPATSTSVLPGQALPVDIKVPKTTAKKYSGAKLTATVTVTAADGAGNRSTTTASHSVTLRTYKVAKKKHHKG
jgi:hypothetical protein